MRPGPGRTARRLEGPPDGRRTPNCTNGKHLETTLSIALLALKIFCAHALANTLINANFFYLSFFYFPLFSLFLGHFSNFSSLEEAVLDIICLFGPGGQACPHNGTSNSIFRSLQPLLLSWCQPIKVSKVKSLLWTMKLCVSIILAINDVFQITQAAALQIMFGQNEKLLYRWEKVMEGCNLGWSSRRRVEKTVLSWGEEGDMTDGGRWKRHSLFGVAENATNIVMEHLFYILYSECWAMGRLLSKFMKCQTYKILDQTALFWNEHALHSVLFNPSI